MIIVIITITKLSRRSCSWGAPDARSENQRKSGAGFGGGSGPTRAGGGADSCKHF